MSQVEIRLVQERCTKDILAQKSTKKNGYVRLITLNNYSVSSQNRNQVGALKIRRKLDFATSIDRNMKANTKRLSACARSHANSHALLTKATKEDGIPTTLPTESTHYMVDYFAYFTLPPIARTQYASDNYIHESHGLYAVQTRSA